MKYWKRQVRFEEEFGALSVEELEDIAQEEYAKCSDDEDRLNAALIQRRRKLNETFRWTAENKVRLLFLNTKLMDCFEKLKTEITKEFQHLQKRLNTTDDFLQDFYVRPRFSDAEDDSIEEILAETWNEMWLNLHFFPATESIENALDDNIHFNRDLNWNDTVTPQLQRNFNEHYISYSIHELFDHIESWSNSDVLKINTLMAEYRVTYQHFTEIF